jgi:DNA repair photolyase
VVVNEIIAKSILRKHKRIDSWFISQYGMNLYRGCTHNCVYCDGRSEGYYVQGEFGKDVWVKTNAIEILRKELDPKRKRIPLKRCYIMLGGGVGDSYQPIENKYKLCRKTLELLYKFNYPVSILTKSTLIEHDIDIIKKINVKNKVIVSFSFSSFDDIISSIFEPGVPLPSERFETLKTFKKEGIACGMFLMPVIPFISDKPKIMEEIIKKAKEINLDFIVFSGKQKKYFFKVLQKRYPELISEYFNIYKNDFYGRPIDEYQKSINNNFNNLSKKYKIPRRIPPFLFKDILSENDYVFVILEHLDYLMQLEGKKSSFRWAANSVLKLNRPISEMQDELRKIKGIGPKTEKIILELINTGSSSLYDKLLTG